MVLMGMPHALDRSTPRIFIKTKYIIKENEWFTKLLILSLDFLVAYNLWYIIQRSL
jgi:hypothetical protein